MTLRAVHWHEGMFLRPHHFQAAQRHEAHLRHLDEKWDHHFDWGLRAVEIDPDALANNRFVVRSLRARLRDGTLVSVPEDGILPALDLQGAFDAGSPVTLSLAVPLLNLGRANASASQGANGSRYSLDAQELEDENTGTNPQRLQFRLPNLKILTSHQDPAGYEVLPIARVEKSARAGGTPQLDPAYIPPVLACDAWQPLRAGVLEQVFDRIGKKQEVLAAQVVSRGIGLESSSQGDRAIIEQLRVLNEAVALLGVLAFAPGVHPLGAYQELARLVGQLSIFDRKVGPRAPALPRYDHDDLGGCFFRVKQYLHALLDAIVEPDYQSRPFLGASLRLQVPLEPTWLEAGWQLFVGVKSPLPAEECVRLLTRPGQLDMKLGSSERVDDIFRHGQRGLNFAHTPTPPRALPSLQGLIYFQVNRESQEAEWQNVGRSLALAVRLNETRIEGNIQGQEVLKLKTATGQPTTLQFTLYVVRGAPAAAPAAVPATALGPTGAAAQRIADASRSGSTG
jgi:type VI secretion system protein ImpJ